MAWLLFLLAVVVGVWAATAFGALLFERMARAELQKVLPGSDFAAMEIGYLPPRLIVREIVVREGQRIPLRAARVTLAVLIGASLWEGLLVFDAEVESPVVTWTEADAFWKLRSGEGEAPALRPRRIWVSSGTLEADLRDARTKVRFEGIRADLSVEGVVEPALRIELEARGSVERFGKHVPLQSVTVRGQWSSGAWVLESARIQGALGTMEAAGRSDGHELTATVRSQASFGPLSAIVPEAPTFGGRAVLDLKVGGSVGEVQTSGRVEADGVTIGDVGFSGSGSLQTRGDRWTLSSAAAAIFGGRVEGSAEGRFRRGLPYHARGRFQDWEPKQFIELFDLDTPIRGRWSGEGELTGLLAGDDLEGGGTFTLREQGAELSGRASFRVHAAGASVDGSIASGSGDHLECRVRFEDVGLRGTVTLEGPRLGAFSPFVAAAFDASGRMTASFTGPKGHPELVGDVDLANLTLAGIAVGRLAGPFAISKSALVSDRLRAEDLRIEAGGRVSFLEGGTNDWHLSASDSPLDALGRAGGRFASSIPQIGGRISGTVAVRGSWSAPDIDADFVATAVEVWQERIARIRGRVSRAAGAWDLSSDLALSPDTPTTIRAHVGPDGALRAAVRGDVPLATVRAFSRRWRDLRGNLHVDGTVAGTIESPVGRATLRGDRLEVEGRSTPPAAVDVVFERRRVSFRGTLGEVIEATGGAELAAPFAFELGFRWHDLDLGRFLAPGGDVRIDTRGDGDLRGDADDAFRAGSLRVDRLSVGRSGREIRNVSAFVVTIERGVLTLPPTDLAATGQHLRVQARLGPDESSVRAAGSGDLGVLELLTTTVVSARGEVSVDLLAFRRGSDPWQFGGQALLAGGSLDVGVIGLTDLRGRMDFHNRAIHVGELTGSVGGGDFRVSGDVEQGREWNLAWELREANLGMVEWLDSQMSGRGRLQGPFDMPTLSGSIGVDRAVYDRRIEWSEFLPWFRREARIERRRPTPRVALDLRVFADGEIFIDNNLAKAELWADLHLGGTTVTPELTGRLDVLEGEFTFRRRTFTLAAGTAWFVRSQPWNPTVEIRGETLVATRDADYEIELRVSGTAEKPRIEFTVDDPALTQNDVLALVTFGRTVDELRSQGASIELQEVLALTTGPYASEVESRLSTLVPVDRIEIEPSFSRTTGTTEPRLSIGKDLTEKLTALLGTGLGTERRQDVALEYQLGPRVSLQAAWESQTQSSAGAFGGTIKFRHSFWKFSLLPGSLLSESSR
ncbi:MAG: translocation and assembly module TamB [Candidatus Binatota bacterium]|nr:translocation and assembly module TamB [Candidatus Binatota bacterium]